jgi:PAS domain S-box-containing protein
MPDVLLKAIFEQAALPLALVDGLGLIAMWNPAFDFLFRSLTGVGPDKLTASFFDFVVEREGARLDFYAAEILLGGRSSAAVESRIRASDGTLRWLRLSLSRIEPSTSSATSSERFLLCAAEEVTDRILRETRLREAKEEAEKATHTKSQFLANMSHEIRTPIQTILGVVELLHETELDSEQSDYVNQVRFSADVLLGLINDILDFSKIEAGRLELETASFDLRPWVYQSVELLAMEASRKGLEIIVDVDDALPALVRGDPGRIRQVIVNLFKNAVKFTREGGITLTLRRISSPSGPRMRFEVADTGPGIPEATRERLFTPFFQGDLAQARKAGGTGLGLAISRHLVELMGGSIGVLATVPSLGALPATILGTLSGTEPAPDGGSRAGGSIFWFELPLDAPEYSAPPSAGAPSTLSASAGGERLLVVDDYPAAREIAAKYASTALYRVNQAGSGEEALAELRDAAASGEPFSLCLIDQNMPRMDGWRLASEITGDTAINGARLILMAPQGSINADAKMKLLRWFNSYLSKPIKPNELLDALSRALSSEVDLEGAEGEEIPEAKPPERRFEGEVLLAEDHEVNRELFTLFLQRMGCRVVTARDGVEAVEIGSSRRFDLVLMDIFMPRMSGYDAARALRDRGYSGPIVAVTASALKGERENCVEAGMDDILVKPFKKDDLANLLADYLPDASGRGTEHEGKDTAREGDRAAVKAQKPSMSAELRPLDSSVFDWAGVLDTFLGQKDTVAGLLSRFIEKAGTQMGELAQALGAEDAVRFHEVSHSLKGASWNLSARRLGDAALLGETAGREKDLAAAAEALTAIRAAYEDFTAVAAPYAKGIYSESIRR